VLPDDDVPGEARRLVEENGQRRPRPMGTYEEVTHCRTSADTRLVKRELGWSPRVSLAEGLRRQLLWAASNDEEERQGSA
jgi:nucleoside-diphosphate-sugar epimerase